MPITIEPGKFYKTRDGRKVGPLLENAGNRYYPWTIKTDTPLNEYYETTWMNDGRFHKHAVAGTEALDLVAEWTDEFPHYYAEVDLPPTGPTPDERQAVALEKIAALLEQIAAHLAPTAEPAPQPDAGGWIDWHGGDCPVDPTDVVDIRLRGDHGKDRDVSDFGAADSFRWDHLKTDGYAGNGDIVAYRIHRP